MSIENLKKILESEKRKLIKTKYKKLSVHNTTIYTTNALTKSERRAFKSGYEAATNRLLLLLENAFNILSEINIDNPSFEDSRLEWVEIQIDKSQAKEIREFMAEIKKESGK